MKIDRQNYEEYFILYWDNELTSEQKQLVEQFVQQNTDLEEEFNLLGITHFSPDETFSFRNKEFLFKEEFSPAQQLLLSYVDNELEEPEKSALEKYISIDSAAQQDLALLQKVKLQPDEEIIFPDKSSLYRKEEKVIILKTSWFRIAAAALIIFIAGLTALLIISRNPGTEETPLAGRSAINFNDNKAEGKNTPDNKITEKEKQTDQVIEPALVKTKDKTVNESQTDFVTTSKRNEPVIKKEEPDQIGVAKNDLQENDLPYLSKEETDALPVVASDNPDIINSYSVTTRPPVALNTTNADYGDVLEPKDNGGIRGLLRKATRVFERRTNIPTTTEDNKLLVGAFAVSLK